MTIKNQIEDESKERRWRCVWMTSLGVIAVLSATSAIVLCCSTPVAIRDATELCRQITDRNFEPAHYQAKIINESADRRFYRVVFLRRSSEGLSRHAVAVPKRRFQMLFDGLVEFL